MCTNPCADSRSSCLTYLEQLPSLLRSSSIVGLAVRRTSVPLHQVQDRRVSMMSAWLLERLNITFMPSAAWSAWFFICHFPRSRLPFSVSTPHISFSFKKAYVKTFLPSLSGKVELSVWRVTRYSIPLSITVQCILVKRPRTGLKIWCLYWFEKGTMKVQRKKGIGKQSVLMLSCEIDASAIKEETVFKKWNVQQSLSGI